LQEQDSQIVAHRTSMPIIKCVCGTKILVVPDLRAMDLAIKNHVAEHKKTNKTIGKVLAPGLLTEFLTKQVIIKASKMHLTIDS
jgi:hypothetical protein